MNIFENYKIAELGKENIEIIAEYENKIKAETGRDIVLIAYEKTESKKS